MGGRTKRLGYGLASFVRESMLCILPGKTMHSGGWLPPMTRILASARQNGTNSGAGCSLTY